MRDARPFLLACIAALLLPAPPARAAAEEIGDPYAAYAAGEFDRALQGFVDLQVEHPDDPRLALHLGSAHYEMKNYAEAEAAFGQAALHGDDPLRERAYYSLGNNAYRQGKLDEAVEWYKRALEIDPDDEDAKFNLEFVRDEIRRRHEEAQKRQQEQQQQQKQCDNPQQQQQEQQQQGEQEQQQQQGEQEQQQPGEREQQQQGEQEQQQQPGEGQPLEARPMTREEAERYLQGLSEDRKKHLEKKRARTRQARRPAKDW